jgi:branched-chain amino acid transport system substrate-binding protein
MNRLAVSVAAIGAASLTLAGPAQAKDLTIGYISTLSGPAASLGVNQVNGFKLGLEHQGWKKDGDKISGVPTKVVIGDSQAKVDVGLRLARKMIRSDGAQIIAGIIWSNLLMTLQRPVIRAGRILMSTNAGAAPMAGKRCSKMFVSTSFQNDEAAEAMGLLMNKDKIGKVVVMAPNYQAGKDYIAGFQRTFKGKTVGQILFKINQQDYQAEISRVRSMKPEAVFIFAPGGMGIAFSKQWVASGINKDVKLYTVFVIDSSTLKAIGKAAVGTYHTSFWSPDLDTPRNKKFVKDYVAKYDTLPAGWAADGYDAATLIADGLKRVNGNISDLPALVAAMRKGGLRSVRGDLKYNVNGFLIQPYYRREVVLNDKGVPTIKIGEQVMFRKDSYWEQCPKKQRVQ